MSKSPDYKYYEIEVCDSRSPGLGSYSFCIKGVRQPTKEEAAAFLAGDLEQYGCDNVLYVGEISSEEAHDAYDMNREDTFPIFGVPVAAATRQANPDTVMTISENDLDALGLDWKVNHHGPFKFLTLDADGNARQQEFQGLMDLCDDWMGEGDLCPANDAPVVMTFETLMEAVKELIHIYAPRRYENDR